MRLLELVSVALYGPFRIFHFNTVMMPHIFVASITYKAQNVLGTLQEET